MTKDPAFLFYYQDFAYGTRNMTFKQKGGYIELLCEQADHGHLTIDIIYKALQGDTGLWDEIKYKFAQDKRGLFFNKTLENHIRKRHNYVKSRVLNLKKRRSHMGDHMENVNVNVNVIKNNQSKFNTIWDKYPRKVGRKEAIRHFNNSIKTKDDYNKILIALQHYIESKDVQRGFIQHGSTWFNNWQDWVEYEEKMCSKCKDKGKYISKTGYEVICDCPAGK